MKKLAVCILLLASSLAAQAPGTVQPSVIMASVAPIQMSPGETRRVELDFRVSSSFHINSNKPHSNLLIPTTLKLMAPKPMEIASIQYPAGEDQTFPFSPNEKLSVYTGDFTVYVVLKAPPFAHGGASFPVGGELYYQACDKNACYPPKKLAVDFSVTVR
jgi:Disulphide bond corrector protein DsbC